MIKSALSKILSDLLSARLKDADAPASAETHFAAAFDLLRRMEPDWEPWDQEGSAEADFLASLLVGQPRFEPVPGTPDAGAVKILRTAEEATALPVFAAHVALLALTKLRPIEEWHEDLGAVLWWRLPVDEPPYCGTPLDGDWPYEDQGCPPPTHWTYLPAQLLWPSPQGGGR